MDFVNLFAHITRGCETALALRFLNAPRKEMPSKPPKAALIFGFSVAFADSGLLHCVRAAMEFEIVRAS